MLETVTEAPLPSAKTFISYSRVDAVVARQLHAFLRSQNVAAFLDTEDIAPAEQWRERLGGLIANADAIVFVISDDALRSEVCRWEIDSAFGLGKRIIPLVHGPIVQPIPSQVSALNFVYSDAPDGGRSKPHAATVSALQKILSAIQTDIVWVRQHSKFVARADEWARASPELKSSLLLRKGEVDRARSWMTLRPSPASPEISEILLNFIGASEAKETEDIERLLTITGRAFFVPAKAALEQQRLHKALRIAGAGIVLSEDAQLKRTWQFAKIIREAIGSFGVERLRANISTSMDRVSYSPDGRYLLLVGLGSDLLDAETGDLVVRMPLGIDGVVACNSKWSRAAGAPSDIRGPDRYAIRVCEIPSGREVTLLRGHEGEVFSIRFSQDNRLLVTASNDGTARLWNAENGEQLAVVTSHRIDTPPSKEPTMENILAAIRGGNANHVTQADVSVDGTRILSADLRGLVLVSEPAEDGKPLRLIGHQGAITVARFYADSSWILTASTDKTVKLWDSKTGSLILDLQGHSGSICWAEFALSMSRIISASEDGVARIWNAFSGELIQEFKGHRGKINALQLCGSGTRLFSASDDGTLRIWDIASGEALVDIDMREGPVKDLASSCDGKRLAAVTNGSLKIWDSATSAVIAVDERPSASAVGLRTSNNCSTIVTQYSDGEVRVLRRQAHSTINWSRGPSFGGHVDIVTDIATSEDGSLFATASLDKTATVSSAVSGERAAVLQHDQPLTSVFFGSNSGSVVTSDLRGSLKHWNFETGRILGELHTGGPGISSFVARGNYVAVSSKSEDAIIWNINTDERRVIPGSRLSHFVGFSDDSSKVGISGPGSYMTGSFGLRVLDTSDLSVIRELPKLSGLLAGTMSPSGSRFVEMPQPNSIKIWNLDTAERSKHIVLHTDDITGVHFSRDETLLVTCSRDGTARLWNETGEPVGVFRHPRGFSSALLSADGSFLVTTSSDGAVRFWDTTRAKALSGPPLVLLAAALTAGRGNRTNEEKHDLVLQAAPNDICSALMRILAPAERGIVGEKARLLGQPLAANCYLARSSIVVS